MLPTFRILDLSTLPHAPEVEETGTTFHENSALKAIAISTLTQDLVLADDSGLEVDALGGAPGVYSARYAGDDGDAANNAKLLRELGQEKNRQARFRCVLTLAQGGEVLAHFDGSVDGKILSREAPGPGEAFGYDPLFAPEGYQESFAELGSEIKNRFSHRSRALSKLQSWLLEKPDFTTSHQA